MHALSDPSVVLIIVVRVESMLQVGLIVMFDARYCIVVAL